MSFLRISSAVLAILYSALMGYMLFTWWVYGMYDFHDIRWLEAVLALACGLSVLAGRSAWYVFGGMSLILIRQFVAYPDASWGMITGILGGTWHYSKLDVMPFAFMLLPLFGAVSSLMAEGRWWRAFRFVRRWPYHKDA